MKIDVKPVTNTMRIVGWSPILLEVKVFLLLYLRKEVGLKHVEVPFASDGRVEEEWANNSIARHRSPDSYSRNVNFFLQNHMRIFLL